MNSVKNGLLLWYNYVLPALLPFIITVNLLKSTPFPIILSKLLSPITSRLFKVSDYGVFAIVSGMLSGYPLGAKLVSELYTEKRLTRTEAQYLLSFTNNSGPLFIIGTLGSGMLSNKSIGIFLLIIHYLSALIIGIALPKPQARISYLSYNTHFDIGKELKASISNSIDAIVLIGGYIVFFSMLCTILHQYLNPLHINTYLKGLLFGILEVTNGCKELTSINPLSLSLISGIIAFGGISIHTQSIGYIVKAQLSSKKYLLSKAIQGILAFLLCLVIYPLYAQQGCR